MTRARSRAGLLGLCAVSALAFGLACRQQPAEAVFAISTPYEIHTLDPHALNRLDNVALSANLYEPLVRRDADLKLQPALAVRWFSESPSTWIFDIRPGVQFHDGRALAATDVVRTFARLRDRPELQLGVNTREIESVRELGPMRVEIRTRRPMPVLLNLLSAVAILPAGDADAARPVGTGPYRLAEWKRGESLRLSPHAGYWGKRPELRNVLVRLRRAGEEAGSDLLAGRSQIAILNSRAAESTVAAAGLGVVRRTGLFVKFLGFDLARETTPHVTGVKTNPFRDPRVRQAISLAIDRARLVERVPEPAVPANQPVPPVVFGFNPDLPDLPLDLQAARALLRKSGHAHGFGVTLHTRRAVASSAAVLQEMLAPIGVRVSVVELGDSELEAAAPSLYLGRFACETGDASDMLTVAMHAADSSLLRATDPAGQTLQAAIREALESELPEARGQALRGLMAMVMQNLPIVPLYFDEEVYGLRGGWTWRPRADGYVLAAEVSRAGAH